MTSSLHPGANRAVLACACGRVLNTGDMVRLTPPGRRSATALHTPGRRTRPARRPT